MSGSLDLSRVAGDPAAIALTQRDPVHLYQRPDGPLDVRFDQDLARAGATRRSGSRRWAASGSGSRPPTSGASPGFEINDIGFLRQADQQEWTSWANLAFNQPNRIFQQLRWNFNNWEYWSAAGLPTERAFNTNVHIQFTNRWWLHMGGTIGQVGATYCDRCARGGPAVRQDPYLVALDHHRRRRPPAARALGVGELHPGRPGPLGDRSISRPTLDLKVSSRFSTSLSAEYNHNRNDLQYFGTFTDAGRRAALHLRASGAEDAEPDLAAGLHLHAEHVAPALRLAVHLQGDLHRRARGGRAAGRRLRRPLPALHRSPRWPASRTGFNFQQFRSNVVFRWEYRPGSTLFLVWSQGREGSATAQGDRSFRGDLGDLFGRRANDTFLVKVSYWITP